jgi:hypothetical protein
MPSTSVVEICNRALQKLGAARITSLTQDTPNARSCNVAYNVLRKAELRSHPWSFAIKRAELAADASKLGASELLHAPLRFFTSDGRLS